MFVWLVSLRGQTGETENLSAKDLHILKYEVFRLAPTRKSVVLRGFEKTNSCGIHFCNDIWDHLIPKGTSYMLDPWRLMTLLKTCSSTPVSRERLPPGILRWSCESQLKCTEQWFSGGGGLSLEIQAIWSVLTICAIKMLGKNDCFPVSLI